MNDKMSQEALKYLGLLEQSVIPAGKMQPKSILYHWPEPKTLSNGAIQSPYIVYSKEMANIWQWLRERGYVQPFDYVEWMREFFADTPITEMNWINTADKEVLSKVLFCINRYERFHDGLCASLLNNGYFLKIYHRILVLEGIL